MMFVDFTAGNKDYKLRLNTRQIVTLEKQLGCNPVAIFRDDETLPTITEMVNVLYSSLVALNHGVTLNDAYDIFDKYIEDGHSVTDFITVILDIYKVSGLIKTDEVNNEENSKN